MAEVKTTFALFVPLKGSVLVLLTEAPQGADDQPEPNASS
jgi:hypothetical protein